MERWGNEKGEVVIEACDPEVLSIVVDYMYGADLPSMVLNHNFSFSILISTPGSRALPDSYFFLLDYASYGKSALLVVGFMLMSFFSTL